MINLYIYIILIIISIITIVRTFNHKNIYVTLMSVLSSVTFTALVVYVSLYQVYIFNSDLLILKILIGLVILIGVIISAFNKKRDVIVYVGISNAFFAFLIFIMPILILYNVTGTGLNNDLHYNIATSDIIWTIVLTTVVYVFLYMTSLASKDNSHYTSEIHLKEIELLKDSKDPKEILKYKRYKSRVDSLEHTFYPLSYFGLFIISIVIIGLYSLPLNYSGYPTVLTDSFFKDITLANNCSYSDHYGDLQFNTYRETEAEYPYQYKSCILNTNTEVETCIQTRDYASSELQSIDGFYFISEHEVYYFKDDVITRIFAEDTLSNDRYVLYRDKSKVFIETETLKFELTGSTVSEIEEFDSVYAFGTPHTTYGNLFIRTSNDTTIIDGYVYDVNIRYRDLQFFNGLITNGIYEFRDGELIEFGTDNERLYEVQDKYYKESGVSIDIFVNSKNSRDIIRIDNDYGIRKKLITDEDGFTYVDEIEVLSNNGYRLDIYTISDNVSFSVFWMLVLNVLLNGLYYGIQKETYRKR